jgi:hypothetical protein
MPLASMPEEAPVKDFIRLDDSVGLECYLRHYLSEVLF